ncbi:MAG: S41 family peptidase [Chthonomonadales bacterium]
MSRLILLFAIILSLLPVASRAQLAAVAEKPIRIGRMPSLSPDGAKICFGYQGNLWVTLVAGGAATRLTANDSYDNNPRWSADGQWIAFNSNREGGSQIFVIPSVGGTAKQITFHSSTTTLCDWFPDGKALLVMTARETRYPSLYRLDLPSGRMHLLVTDTVKSILASLSPDGKWIAYTRGALADVIRKGYRGSANYDVYIAPVDRSAPPRKLTDSDRNDMWPAWSADSKTVYYCSERAGTMTVWKQGATGGNPVRVVNDPMDAVRYLSASRNGQMLAYECDNRICTTPVTGGPAKEVFILCRTDEKGPKTTFANYSNTNVSEYAVAPDGKHTAVIIRGDIFLATNDKPGEAKRLTDTPSREIGVTWSPDSKSIVYTSNQTGRFKLYRMDIATKDVKTLTAGDGIDSLPTYSPDGKWIAFLRSPNTSIHLIRPDGKDEQVAVKGPKIETVHWSPDGKWLAYNQEDAIRVMDVWVARVSADAVPVKVGTPINVSDHPGSNELPDWVSDGTKLLFRSNRYRNRDIETINDSGKYSLYSVSLEKEKEKFDEDDEPAKPAEKKPVDVKINPDEIEKRAKSVTAPEGGVVEFKVSPDGKSVAFTAGPRGQTDLWLTPIEGGSTTRLTTGEGPRNLQWSADSNKVYYISTAQSLKSMTKTATPGAVAFTVRMQTDRIVDYKAIFDEGWGKLNDWYYDKTFHGVDWLAVGAKYRGLIDQVTTRVDFDYLFTQMLGELNSSHTGFRNAATTRPARATGMLGVIADSEYAGPGVRISSVTPRSPADRDESRLRVGEYILSVDDATVLADSTLDQALTDKVNRTVVLKVNSKPSLEGARTVKIKPITIAAHQALLYEQWIDGRRAAVEKASGGRIGYLHVSDMGDDARNRFERDLYSIGQRKEGMVIDVRGNMGGDTHDSLLRMIERNKHYFTFAPRLETPFAVPERAYTKPLILLTDGEALSDAEVFANGFRELGLGKIVGEPTMGWIIFTYGFPLLDGTVCRIPHLGCFTNSGKDMENWGVPVDIRVENTPADAMAGRDPQVERAVEEVLKDPRLKK